MPKRQKYLQEIELEPFKKTYGEFNLSLSMMEQNDKGKVVEKSAAIDTMVMARLINPEKYEYQQKHRLYRNATEATKICLEKLSRIMDALPESYKVEVTTSGGFDQFNRSSIQALKIQEKKQKEFNPVAFNHYSQMLVYGLQGVVATMPLHFSHLLLQQLEPFITTMMSISSFAKFNNPKSKVPNFVVPYELLPAAFRVSVS